MKWKKDKTEEGALLNDDFSSKMKRFLINYYPVLILVGLIIVASLISDIFMSTRNISNLVRQQVTYMIIAIGVMMVLLTGGIDLSVSSIAAGSPDGSSSTRLDSRRRHQDRLRSRWNKRSTGIHQGRFLVCYCNQHSIL